MADSISNSDDIIDSRDVIKRIEELEGEADALQTEYDEAQAALEASRAGDDSDPEALKAARDEAQKALANWHAGDDGEELAALKTLQSEAEGYSDWIHGAVLVRDSYFEDHAQSEAESLYGREISDAKWPFTCIDWEKAARELQQDYTSVDFGGVDYWVR